MLQYQQLELLAEERQKMFQEEAELRRLEKLLLAQVSPKPKPFQHLAHWIGAHLVYWGLQLQGEDRSVRHHQPVQSVRS